LLEGETDNLIFSSRKQSAIQNLAQSQACLVDPKYFIQKGRRPKSSNSRPFHMASRYSNSAAQFSETTPNQPDTKLLGLGRSKVVEVQSH
jgi:hypothetical protein